MARPIPVPSAESRPFWSAASAGELHLPRCRNCGNLHYPPPARCPECLTEALHWEQLSGRGRLWSWTEIFVEAIPGFEPPILVTQVELAEQQGLVLTAGGDSREIPALTLGSEVQLCFTEPVDGFRFPLARPA